MAKKIATCCYCGTRAVLVMDKARHELMCSACGAPLHDMKFMPQPAEKAQKKPKVSKREDASAREAVFGQRGRSVWSANGKKSSKKRKKKPVFRRFLEDIFDEIEDIFD